MRGQLLSALARTRDPELAARARALALDERLRTNEVLTPLYSQLFMPETRDATWEWVVANFPALRDLLESSAGRLPGLGSFFCSEERADAVETFFAEHIEDLPGGPRNLASTLESIRLCAARAEAHRVSATEVFR